MTMMNKRLRISAVLGAFLLVGVTGCAGETAEAGSGGDQKVTIQEPAEGASVDIPFTLRLDSSVELGTTESGKNHVHLYFDGDDSEYEVVESDSMEITKDSPPVKGLEPGEHELNISLRNADHSAAGFETKIMVQVGGSGGGEQPAEEDTGTGDGY